MKRNLFFLFISVVAISFAQTAPAYYQSIDFSQSSSNVKSQLAQLITNTQNHVTTYDELWDLLKQTDADPNNTQNVLLIYGWDNSNSEDDDDLYRDKNETCGDGNPCTDETWNREHVFPKSLDNSSSSNQGPTADPHMLRSSDVQMNGLRGNKMFDNGNGIASYVTSDGGFYPGENWKGDVARIIMFMFLRYGNDWNPNYVGDDVNSYHADMPDIFLEWNAEDPVSQYELNRNNIVQEYQGNRNPFIDNPYLATVIWGGPNANNTWPGTLSIGNVQTQAISLYPNPAKGEIVINGITPKTNIYIYDALGRLVKETQGQKIIKLDKNGMHIIKVVREQNVETFKVLNTVQ